MTEQFELSSCSWTDVELMGIVWGEGGRDIAMRLSFPEGGVGNSWWLRAEWVSKLSVELNRSDGVGGYPLTWDGIVSRAGTGWKVALDFGSVGHVSFACSTLVLQEDLKI